MLTMTAKDYKTQAGFAFVPSHNPSNYPHIMGNAQEQAIVTKKSQQNQALFQKYTAMDKVFKNQIVAAVEPVFLSLLVYHLTGFTQVSTLTMIQYIFSRYRVIDKIYLEENAVKMMGTYDPVESLA